MGKRIGAVLRTALYLGLVVMLATTFLAGEAGAASPLRPESLLGDSFNPATVTLDANKTVTSSFVRLTSGFDWLHQFGNTSDTVEGKGVAVDPSGNAYVVGLTNGAIPGQTWQGGGYDEFLAKYDTNGNTLWLKQVGSQWTEEAVGIAMGGDGYIYTVGSYCESTAGFLGNVDATIRQFDSSGNLIQRWPVDTGPANNRGRGIAVDSSNNIYIIGDTNIDTGDGSSGGRDIFVAKYSNSGILVWIHQVGSSGDDRGSTVAVDADDNIYITGTVGGAIDGQASAGSSDAFVLKYNSIGEVLWIRQFGTSAIEESYGLVVDHGFVYTVGRTNGDLAGTGSSGNADVFLRQFTSDGMDGWTRQFGTGSDDIATGGSTVDGNHNIFLGGWTGGTLPGQIASGGVDGFIGKYDSQGNPLWLRQFGSSGSDQVYGLAHVNSLYMAGYTTGVLPAQNGVNGYDAFAGKSTEITYTLTTVVNPAGSGTVTKNPNQTQYNSGTPVQLTANPAGGWAFAGWSGALTGTTNPTTITMDANKTVTATFSTAAYTGDFNNGNANGWVPQGGTWTVVSGRYTSSTSGNTYSIYNEQVFDDFEMTADIWTSSNVTPGSAVGLYVRAQDPAGDVGFNGWKNNGYACFIQSGWGIQIARFYNGAYYPIFNSSFTVEHSTLYHFRIRAEGASLKLRAWKNGSSEPPEWQVEYADNGQNGPIFFTGKIGVHAGMDSGQSGISFDNIVVTPIALSNGAVSYWNFNESTGTVASDSWDGNNGTVNGATWTTGKVGGALSFNGTGAYVSALDSTNLNPQQITIETWIKPSSATNVDLPAIVDKFVFEPAYGGYALHMAGSSGIAGNPQCLYFAVGTAGGLQEEVTDATVPLNVFSHVTASYDGTDIRIYINGSEVPTRVPRGFDATGAISPSNNPLAIGRQYPSPVPGNRFFQGTIDEVKVFNRALSAQEIQQEYLSGGGTPPTPVPGVSDYGLYIMAGLFAGAAFWTLRRMRKAL